MSESRTSNSMLAFVVGVGIGALVGILFAPKSGDETREYLVGGARDALNTVASTGQKFARNARQTVTDTTEQVRQTVNEKAEQVRQALNNGADQVREAVNETADQVRQAVSDTAGQVKKAAHEGERAYTKARGA